MQLELFSQDLVSGRELHAQVFLLLHNKDSSNKGTKLKAKRKRNCEKPAGFTEESAGKGGSRGGQLSRELNLPQLWVPVLMPKAGAATGSAPLPPLQSLEGGGVLVCWRDTALASPQCEEERRSEAVSPFKMRQIARFGQNVSPGSWVGWGHPRGAFPLRRFPARGFSAGEESVADSSYNLFLTSDLLNWKKPNPPS